MRNHSGRLRLASAVLLATILLSGCGLIASFPGLGTPTPGDGGAAGGGAVGGGAPATIEPGGTDGAGGSGIGGGIGVMPPGGEPDNPTIVFVHPGQANLREVRPVQLTSLITASHQVLIRVRWWGGIEPCDVLDSVDVARDGSSFTITARVGSSAGGQVACIDIARDTATIVDLGVLAAGQYTVRASAGDAPPVTVAVP